MQSRIEIRRMRVAPDLEMGTPKKSKRKVKRMRKREKEGD